MENFYLFIVIILFVFAITDLVVGVSNDAVNFLNSAIGSKAGKFWVIMIVASLGVFVGATFSNGMMEVARKGIFHPEQFVFSEIILIFLAVMMTDIILLDLFNTFGFPTSTTVSLVFELLGAAVAISLIKIGMPEETRELTDFINSGKALAIIFGILVSVVIAFTVGAIIQYIVRLVFTFNFEKTYKYFGSTWGGISATAITYFMFIKGLKGSSFAEAEFTKWILNNTWLVLSISFVAWTIILEIFKSFFKVNIFKFIVLIGTFSLAMAFAGNDLVNFIGVPLAGYSSYEAWISSGMPADGYTMEILSQKVQINPLFLLIAGLIMVATLWISRKARSVTQTTLLLARQERGQERFESTLLSRSLVRIFVNMVNGISSITPKPVKKYIEKRFEKTKQKSQPDGAMFDLVRASVNLVVASILIAIGTSLKLPLSTTYVTFMVAMGTSLSDRAWGRESAVYRVTGVLSVIGGWFITAIVAFTAAFIIAYIIYYGQLIAIFALLVAAIFVLYKTKILHQKRQEEKEKEEAEILSPEQIVKSNGEFLIDIFEKIPATLYKTVDGLETEDRQLVKKARKKIKKLNTKSKDLKNNIHFAIDVLKDGFFEASRFYVQLVDYTRELINAFYYTINPAYEHIDNNHQGFDKEQATDFREFTALLENYLGKMKSAVENNNYSVINELSELQEDLMEKLDDYRARQLQRIKDENVDTKSSLLYLAMLSEIKNILLFSMRVLKARRDFYMNMFN